MKETVDVQGSRIKTQPVKSLITNFLIEQSQHRSTNRVR